MNLLICASVVCLLGLRQKRAAILLSGNRLRIALALVSVVSVTSYTNWFQFHRGSGWAHLHDVAHYYLGSKYFDELGYGALYAALARAELEEYGSFLGHEARDLSGSYTVPIERLLPAGNEVKARFTPERWSAFRLDMKAFHDAMGSRFADILMDHGYNPTPVWTLIGGTLSNLVPAGDSRGIWMLTLLDPVLLVAALLAVIFSFGVESGLLVAIYFCVFFGGAFDWIGGAFLRELSFSAILFCACALAGGRPATAGAFLALATMLRAYPLLLAAGAVFRAGGELRRSGRVAEDTSRFLIAFAAMTLFLFFSSALRFHGFGAWEDFARNISAHGESASSNVIGVTSWLAYLRSFDVSSPAGIQELIHWRQIIYRVQLATLFPLAVLFVALQSQRATLLSAIALGTLLVFTGLNISAYYYAYLCLLLLVYRDRPEALAWIFAVELGVYGLALIEPQQVMLYLYKSLLLLGLFLILNAEGSRRPSLTRLAAVG